MGYISTIKTAVQLFPFLALLLTLPYMILNYRKYGSVNKLRVLIFYSFMLLLDDGLSLGDLASARSK